MNCDTTRRSLLAGERPDRPPPDARRHLARCPACRALQRRLIQAERHIPLLPVPPAPVPAELLRRVREGPVQRPTVRLHSPPPPGMREGGRQKVALAFSLAAALAVFAIGWWAWPHQQSGGGNDGLKEYVQRRDQLLAAARTPRARVEALAGLADELLNKALDLVHEPEKLDRLARGYRQLLRHDLPEQAEKLDGRERAAVLGSLPARLQLGDARRLSDAQKVAPPAARASLGLMASAAHDGGRRLHLILSGTHG
jgi:hypothetical protein